MSDAKTLFFIDNHQSEIAKAYVFGKHSMCADDDIDLARFDSLHDVLLFFRRTKTRKQFNLHREGRKPLAKGIEVLVSQHRRRRQHRGLFSIHDSFESRAHRNFCLAVTNVAAQQAIHRRPGFHVVLHIFDCGFLIRSQRVFKAFFKFALPRSVLRKRVALDQLALCIKPQQLVSHVAHRALGFRLRLQPTDSTQAIERGLMTFGA